MRFFAFAYLGSIAANGFVRLLCVSIFLTSSAWSKDDLTRFAPEESQANDGQDFETWVAEFIAEAAGKGLSREGLAKTFYGIKPSERVIELDRRQPEFTQTFWSYLDQRVSKERVRRGRELIRINRDLLAAIETKYAVQGRFLVALWGLETNFGTYLGDFPVIESLATLAYDERRSTFFRAELLDALTILEYGHIEQDNMIGSWAGAMGQPQFMPSTFMRYAVDEDSDGKIDIWNDLSDVFGSSANYLSELGWNNEYTWGREVQLPNDFDLRHIRGRSKKLLLEWQAVGVRKIDGSDLPNSAVESSIILPVGIRGPAFLVYNNFEVILSWNRSLLYALSVGHLADRIVGLGSLRTAKHDEFPLSRGQVTDLQMRLKGLGHKPGEADGQVGPMTRAAVSAFQGVNGLPADGYPDALLYDAVVKTSSDLTKRE